MADTLAPWIESGQIMVLSIDTLDKETWSDTNGDPYWRIRRYEQWLHYIVDEAVPKIRCLSQERNGWDDLPGVIAFGCSLGATHAVNLYLRRPDIFCGCLALSGIYTAHYGFGSYMDELVYQNSPVDYMRNFPHRPPLYGAVPEPEGGHLLRSGRLGAAGHHLVPQAHFRGQGHPRVGGPVGPTTSSTTGTGGINRSCITCRISWDSSKAKWDEPSQALRTSSPERGSFYSTFQ